MLFPNADVMVDPALLMLLGLIVGTLSGFFGLTPRSRPSRTPRRCGSLSGG